MDNINILSQQTVFSSIHNLIPLVCCNSKQNLMIEIFTDGGALHQGSSNALAAYGAIFPHYENFNFTNAIPNYEL